jgi:hypothetical protein
VGATELTIEMRTRHYPILISPAAVPELNKVSSTRFPLKNNLAPEILKANPTKPKENTVD